MDLYTHVQEEIEEASESIPSIMKFPLAAFFALFGFLVILTIEQLVTSHNHSHSHSHSHNPPPQRSRSSPPRSSSLCNDLPLTPTDPDNRKYGSTIDVTEVDNDEQQENHQHLIHGHFSDLPVFETLRVILLVLAVSVHAVFEGLALGLSRNFSGFFTILVALGMHKGVEAIGVGMNLAMSKLSDYMNIIICILFSAATPTGILAGVAVLWSHGQDQLTPLTLVVAACLQSMACGTFFYIVFYEILPHEFHINPSDRLPKLIALFFGFAFVSGYLVIFPHEHSSH